jgi:CheY-like chemotaxis protein
MSLDKRFPTNIPSLQELQILVVDNNIDSCDLMTALLQSADRSTHFG